MKKVILSVVFFAAIVVSAHAQRFAYVDTKYILEKLSDYKGAQQNWMTRQHCGKKK